MEKSPNIKTFFLIVLSIVIGLFIITIGSVWKEDREEFLKNATKIKVSITESEECWRNGRIIGYDYYVTYIVDGKEYKGLYEGNVMDLMQTLYIGKQVDIYYNPKNPSEFQSGFGYGEYVFWVIGGIFLLMAVISIYYEVYFPLFIRKKSKYLRKNGIRIEAELKNLDLKRLIDLGGMDA